MCFLRNVGKNMAWIGTVETFRKIWSISAKLKAENLMWVVGLEPFFLNFYLLRGVGIGLLDIFRFHSSLAVLPYSGQLLSPTEAVSKCLGPGGEAVLGELVFGDGRRVVWFVKPMNHAISESVHLWLMREQAWNCRRHRGVFQKQKRTHEQKTKHCFDP